MAYSKEEVESFKNTIIIGLGDGKSLLQILKQNKMPSRPTVYTWLNDAHPDFDEVFFNNYVRVREESGDYDAEKVPDIVEQMLSGEITPEQARVAIDAYKWSAGVKKPKKYGKSVDLTTKGESINQPQIQRVRVVVKEK